MAYPNGTPSPGVTDPYAGSFTPLVPVASIKDNQTSIDKASLARSIGTQIALIQNFVNSTYLGRSDVPVENIYGVNVSGTNYYGQSSYINYIFADSLSTTTSTSTYLYVTSGFIYDNLIVYGDVGSTSVHVDTIYADNLGDTFSDKIGQGNFERFFSTSGWFTSWLRTGYLLCSGTGFDLYATSNSSIIYPDDSLMVSGKIANYKHSQFVNIMSYDGGLGSSVNIWSSGTSCETNISSRGTGSHVDIYATGVNSYVTISADSGGGGINVLSKDDLNLWCTGTGLLSIKNLNANGDIELLAAEWFTANSTYVIISGSASAALKAPVVALGAVTAINFNCEDGKYYFQNMPTSNPGAGYIWSDGGTIKLGT